MFLLEYRCVTAAGRHDVALGRFRGEDLVNRFGSIPIVLLILLLMSAILLLLALPPARAPPFERLIQLTCDPYPVLPSFRGASGSMQAVYTCRAADGVVRKVTGFSGGVNSVGFTACRRGGGIVKLWLNPSPSQYGRYVFQASCQDEIFMSYPDAASTYESKRAFSQLLAWGLLILSAGALALVAIRRSTRHR